jgi:hypothetical protein
VREPINHNGRVSVLGNSSMIDRRFCCATWDRRDARAAVRPSVGATAMRSVSEADRRYGSVARRGGITPGAGAAPPAPVASCDSSLGLFDPCTVKKVCRLSRNQLCPATNIISICIFVFWSSIVGSATDY